MHDCRECYCACYCNGDIDDHYNEYENEHCRGCGCEKEADLTDDWDDTEGDDE